MQITITIVITIVERDVKNITSSLLNFVTSSKQTRHYFYFGDNILFLVIIMADKNDWHIIGHTV